MPKVSVVIPCYNQGHFLDEAVDSVLVQTFRDFEIIVVDDGSTDPFTEHLLADYRKQKTSVLHTANQGLASARNNGIREASGQYILPLDADDRIAPEYLAEAVQVLDGNPDIGIVYCRARLFGAVDTEWNLPEYSLAEMLQDNLIFCTALFRRADWELAGGYDPGMVYGWEDYDFWLSLIEKGRGVYRIPEYLFSYRVASDSMVRSKEKWQKVAMFKRIFDRHQGLFRQHIEVWIDRLLSCRESYLTSRLYIDTGTGISDSSSIARKIEQGTTVIDFQTTGFQEIQAVRFDPVDSYAVVKIEKIIFDRQSGAEEFPLAELTGNSCLREENIFYFDTPDPQIFFSCDSGRLAGLRQVTVSLRFLALDAEALRLLSDRQQEQLRCLQMENTALKKAGLFRHVGRFLPNFRISG
jgi:glycosyltransferase involved in cell wall biosynthesis